MESPSKRLKTTPVPAFTSDADFVPLDADDDNNSTSQDAYGYDDNPAPTEATPPLNAPRGPRSTLSHQQPRRKPGYLENTWFIRRNAQDKPRSKHALPGVEEWVLVKTKLGRRFVHNVETKESLWRIPAELQGAVREFEELEGQEKEKRENAVRAEEQLKEMREAQRVTKGKEVANSGDNDEGRARRRRSESLQREDEEAMMAEMAAEAQRAEEKDVKEAVANVAGIQPRTAQVETAGYDSESSYEEVEVTDSEFEDEGEDRPDTQKDTSAPERPTGEPQEPNDEPVEFGEDDIAYQLAAMGEDYGLDPGEYGSEGNGDGDGDDDRSDWNEGAEGLQLSFEDAANLFRDLLDDHNISPYTPWEKLISDESETSILMDDRYTLLPSTRARKEVWESWVKDRAAELQAARAKMEKSNPKIPYLAFLQDNATPKLYWPEFKRKFKKDSVMSDRHLADKEREKLYREHIARLKLAERTRVADFKNFLEKLPRGVLHKGSTLDALPEALVANGVFISLPAAHRDRLLEEHIARLPAGADGKEDVQGSADDEKKRADRRKREEALEARRREVEKEKIQAEKEQRWARRGLMEEEAALQRAMRVDGKGLRENLRSE